MSENNGKNPWYKNAIIYQVYPWSFKDSNGDGIGDLEGIIEKLDYLNDGTADSLQIDAIWLSPFYPSPMKDFGYDISDYYNVDERFGTLEIFDRLLTEAHKRNIKIIIDLVTNHTSSEHPWFKESRSSKTNLKRDWYIWHDVKPDGGMPNNWVSVSGGSAWTLDVTTNQYYFHQFLPEQPDLNWRNDDVKKEMQKIIQFWQMRGVDGFRVDAMSHFIEDRSFRDDPANPDYQASIDSPYKKYLHQFSADRPETTDIIKFICDAALRNGDSFIITESYLSLPELIKIYRAVPYQNHAPFNFNFFDIPWSASAYKMFVDTYDDLVGPDRLPIYVLGNHDNHRLWSRLGEAEAKILVMLLLTLRGTSFIYYGEELGMKDVALNASDYKDGFATTSPEPVQSRDMERTPMQWNNTLHAGFTTGTPWLPLSKDYAVTNVESEAKNKNSILHFYRTLIDLRKNHESLRNGYYQSFKTQSPDIFFFSRRISDSACFIILNFSADTLEEPYEKDISILSSTYPTIPQMPSKKIIVRPYEGIIFTHPES